MKAVILLILTGLFSNGLRGNVQSRLPVVSLPSFKRDTFNIIRFGARPDRVTLNTNSINTAFAEGKPERCSVRRNRR